MGGRVFSSKGLAPTIMAGTHGYGFGCILEYGDDTDREFVPTKGRVCQPTRWESLSYDNSSDSKSGWRE